MLLTKGLRLTVNKYMHNHVTDWQILFFSLIHPEFPKSEFF